jgi:two-component system nitrogen regulation sensor histidine kinase NtrY
MFEGGMATILEEVERLSRLVSSFSEFARLPLPERRSTDLHGLIDEVLTLYGAEPGLVVERDFADGIPELSLDPDQISRALKNVVGNALESMREARGEPRLTVSTELERDWVRVEVADRGGGFSAEALQSVFEPYFTTREQGTGLGMSMTYRIVAEHGGVIAVENRSGGGARVVLRLPLDGPGTERDG